MNSYLGKNNLFDNWSEYGLSKVLIVRSESIHLKHIMTECFVKEKVNITNMLLDIDMSVFEYIQYITNRIRRIYNFSRQYSLNCNEILGIDKANFFPTLENYEGLKNCIVLDFDGVITKEKFHKLYNLCIERCAHVLVCTANPTIDFGWFEKKGLPLPKKIFAMKGKKKKIKQLIEIQKRYDNVFYIDNEEMYLEYAWIFGIKTYIYKEGKIKYFTLNNK